MSSTQFSRWLGFFALVCGVVGLTAACNEKQADPAVSTPKKTNTSTGTDTGTGSGDDDDDNGSGSDDPNAAPFDLCKDGLEANKAKIDGFDAYITELCSGDNKLKTLRQESNIYTGGDPKLLKSDPKGTDQVSVRLFTSTLVHAKVSDYFALVKLQVVNPKAFGEHFEKDDQVTMSELNSTDTQASFRYVYEDTENNSKVDYNATTRFYTLKKGQAYLTATKLDKSNDTMKALNGLIIVNKKGDQCEVFTMSDQTIDNTSGQKVDTIVSKTTDKAAAEQKRMYHNADHAADAPGLLKAP